VTDERLATLYPERFAQEALGHNSIAVHRANRAPCVSFGAALPSPAEAKRAIPLLQNETQTMNTPENFVSTPQNPVKPLKFPPQPQEWKIVSLRECPTPEAMQLCEPPLKSNSIWRGISGASKWISVGTSNQAIVRNSTALSAHKLICHASRRLLKNIAPNPS
jgi:hypothetical protein